jgi:hypothetical protein
MQIKVNRIRILTYLFLCFLFSTWYIGVLNTNGIVASDATALVSAIGRGEPSSMNGGINGGPDDYMTAGDTLAEFFISSMRQARWLSPKTGPGILTAIVAAQVTCLLFYSRLSQKTCIQSNASIITAFLHKKDGRK